MYLETNLGASKTRFSPASGTMAVVVRVQDFLSRQTRPNLSPVAVSALQFHEVSSTESNVKRVATSNMDVMLEQCVSG